MRVAVLGAGGREHALAWALERHRHEVTVLPGNGGTLRSAPVKADDLAGVERFCREARIELVIVGPEGPLEKGMVDRLRAAGIAALGPTQEAARLESSKIFAKRFMQAHGVATAGAWFMEQGDDPAAAIETLQGRLVLKYDGLAAGKGVWVCGSVDDARRALAELCDRHGKGARYLLERRLEGDELSIIGDGDQGPNTGGMGAFSPVPQLGPGMLARIQKEVVEPTLAGLRQERLDYRGFIYFGLMLTAEGPRLLEYNVRLGDPEAEAILPLLQSDLAELATSFLERRLDCVELKVTSGAAVSVVLAAPGYPAGPQVGQPIEGLDRLDPMTLVFHAGTRRDGGRLLTNGGRVLDVVARGDTLDEAIARVYAEVAKVRFEGMQLRRDIGRRPWKSARE
jgi:phosphoribosylamine--glycine ligase